MKLIPHLKWILPVIFLTAIGAGLIIYSQQEEEKFLSGYQTHAQAIAALEAGDAETAYILYLQSANEFVDPKLKATALYEAANIGLASGIADYGTLAGLYKQSLRYNPGFYKAAFNLEYLYWLKTNAPEELPQPDPGADPSREEDIPNGDV